MEIDPRFPTKLSAISDAPEPLRSALVEILPPKEPMRLLVHAPAFSSAAEKSPATLLAVTSNGWLVVAETFNLLWAFIILVPMAYYGVVNQAVRSPVV
jgi:hypothetical protein